METDAIEACKEPLLETKPSRTPRSVRTKVPEVEIHLFLQGQGPIDVFQSALGGWDQNRLEVQSILDKYGLHALFSFTSDSIRGDAIQFDPRSGRSINPYTDGAVVILDGDPKEIESDGIESEPDSYRASRSVRTKVPEVEVHLFKQGKGPIDVFKSALGGWDQDRLEVQDILDKYGLKGLFSMSADSGRGVPIRFKARDGRSILPYTNGAVIWVDGEPKDSMVKPVTKILVGVSILTLLIAVFVKETPEWMKTSRFSGGSIPPWVLACVVIVFTRMRKRTKDVLKKFGW